MLPTSVVILCWGILANSSWRNYLRWPRLWFGISRTRTALPNWSRRCPMASSSLSVPCGTFIGLLDPIICSYRRSIMVWSERWGFWTLARIPFAVTKRLRAAIPEILLSVSMLFFWDSHSWHDLWHPRYVCTWSSTCYRWFVHTESPSNIMTQGPWLNNGNGSGSGSVQIT